MAFPYNARRPFRPTRPYRPFALYGDTSSPAAPFVPVMLETYVVPELPPLPPQLTAATECRWVSPQELNELAMPAAHRKLADKLFAGPDAHAAQQTMLPASDQA